jgi:SAM-dependent methyltransferase
MSWYRAAFGRHYPLLYRHRDDREAARCIASLARLAPFGKGPALDLACGEGRHLPFVAAEVAPVVGLDLSAGLLEGARRRLASTSLRIGLVRGDMRRLPFGPGCMTAVLSLFTSFGYFGGLWEHRGLLREIVRILAPGGTWFLDYLNCRAVSREMRQEGPGARRRRSGPFDIKEERRLATAPPRILKSVSVLPLPGREDEAGRWEVPPGGLNYDEEVALFDLPQIDDLAAECGLERMAQAGDYAGGPLRAESSPRWILVYRKVGHSRAGADAEARGAR